MATLAEFRELAESEYWALCAHLGLKPVPLDIYSYNPDAPSDPHEAAVSDWGMDKRNYDACYGWAPSDRLRKILVLPILERELTVLSLTKPKFPPPPWPTAYSPWPSWRTELWHEVVHQVQDQRLQLWNPGDGAKGHRTGWQDAIDLVAGVFSVPSATLRDTI